MTDEASTKLLTALEALVAEVRALREAVDATKTLQEQRRKKAERQARWRNRVGATKTPHVDATVASTGEVVKDLDHKQRDQDLETTPSRRRSVDATRPVWESYSTAYRKRHGAAPVRNATTNAQMLAFVKRVGGEEAPGIAEFYVSHRQAFYVQSMHPVGLLLRDAEKLRTEWVTGRRTTSMASRQGDSTQANVDGWMETAEKLIQGKKHGVV